MALNPFDPSNRMDNPPKPLSNQAEVYARNGTNFLAFNAAVPNQKVYEYQKGAGQYDTGQYGGRRENLDVALRNRRVYGTGSTMNLQENQSGDSNGTVDESVSSAPIDQLGPTGTGVGYGQEPLAPMAFTLNNVKPDLDDTLARRGVFAFKYRDIANPYAYADQYNFDLGGADPFAYGRKTSVSENGALPSASGDKPSGDKPSGDKPSGDKPSEKQSGSGSGSVKRRPRKGFSESSLASVNEMPLRARRQLMIGPERQNAKYEDQGASPDAVLTKNARKNSAWRGGLQLGKAYNYDHNKYESSAENQTGAGGADSQLMQPAGTPLMDSSRVLWPRRLTEKENTKAYGDENLAKFVRQSRDYTDRYNNIKPARYTGKGAESLSVRGEPKYERPSERMSGSPKSRTFKPKTAGAYDPYAWEPGAGRGRRNSWRDKDANHAYDTYGYQQRADWIRTNGNPSEYSAMARNQFGMREQLSGSSKSRSRPRMGFESKVENYTGVFQTDNMECPEGQMMVNGKCIPAIAPGKPVCLPGWNFEDGKCRPAASV